MIEKFLKIFSYISKNHPDNANDYIYAMSLFENCIKDSKEHIKKDCHVTLDSDDDEKIAKTNKIRQEIKDFEKTFSDIFQRLVNSSNTELKSAESNQDTTDLEGNRLWRSLNNDFEGTKVDQLMFNQQIYSVKNLTEAFVKICEFLFQIDNEKFKEMANSKIALGSSIRYLSFVGNQNNYTLIPNTNIYLWTNLNSNKKIDLTKKMLDYFELPYDTVQLSIRDVPPTTDRKSVV